MLNPKSVYWLLLVNLEPLGKPPVLLLKKGTLTPNRPNRSALGWRRRSLCPCCASTWRAGSQGGGGRAWSGGRCAWSACRTAGTGSASPPCECGCGGPARPSGRTSSRSRARCTGRAAHLQHRGRGDGSKVKTQSRTSELSSFFYIFNLACLYSIFSDLDNSRIKIRLLINSESRIPRGWASLHKWLQKISGKQNSSPFVYSLGF